MAAEVDSITIPAFDLGDVYAFAYYFEDRELFGELSEYYNDDAYRFEIPPEELAAVSETLAGFYYELELVDDLEPYCVVIERYEPHAEILKRSVANWTRDDHHFFLMRDRAAVEYALREGATPIEETNLVVGI